jgi:two-component system response regulator AlgR
MHILVVDDETLARQRLCRMIESLDGYEVAGEAATGAQAIEAICQLDPDVVLLDVRMPGDDGLQTARRIAELTDPPAVIFCTAFDQYALEAFDTLALGYLLKPVEKAQLQAALDKAKSLNKAQLAVLARQMDQPATPHHQQRSHISAKTRRGVELVPIETVQCFLADHKYVTVLHDGGETLIDDTLKDLEGEFRHRFVRVHRNSLVAVARIEGLERSGVHYQLRLSDTDYRPQVSRRHVAAVKELLSSL